MIRHIALFEELTKDYSKDYIIMARMQDSGTYESVPSKIINMIKNSGDILLFFVIAIKSQKSGKIIFVNRMAKRSTELLGKTLYVSMSDDKDVVVRVDDDGKTTIG